MEQFRTMKLIRRGLLYPFLALVAYCLIVLLHETYVFYSSPVLKSSALTREIARMASCLPERKDHPSHPIVYPIFLEEGEVQIVKQINYDSFLNTIKSRFLLVHEYAILKSIEDLPGVTKVAGRINQDAFCLQYIPSTDKFTLTTEECCLIKSELKEILTTLHKRHVYHLDLGNLDNMIVSPDRSSHIIDFGRSIKLNPIIDMIVGPFLAYRDQGRFLRSMFWFNPETLDLKELDQLILYRKITSFFSSKKEDPFCEEVKAYRKLRK